MSEEQKKVAEKILDILLDQEFYEWYSQGGNMDTYICASTLISRETLLSDIVRLFKL